LASRCSALRNIAMFGFKYLTLSPQGGVCLEILFHPEEYRTY
jgi:hypothetical protein